MVLFCYINAFLEDDAFILFFLLVAQLLFEIEWRKWMKAMEKQLEINKRIPEESWTNDHLFDNYQSLKIASCSIYR